MRKYLKQMRVDSTIFSEAVFLVIGAEESGSKHSWMRGSFSCCLPQHSVIVWSFEIIAKP